LYVSFYFCFSKNSFVVFIFKKIKPVRISDWEVQFHFRVHGKRNEIFVDGFTFWYTMEKNKMGAVFGSKDYFHGLGVFFFDTYTNHNHMHKVL